MSKMFEQMSKISPKPQFVQNFHNYRIAKRSPNGTALFSTGGSNPSFTSLGRQWECLQNFASHLALLIPHDQKFDIEPKSLIDIYGDTYVVERCSENKELKIKETPFREWYRNYWNTSKKFSKVRKEICKNMKNQKSEPDVKPPIKEDPQWDDATKRDITSKFNNAMRFVPGLKFIGIKSHPTLNESYAEIEIGDKTFALMEINRK